MIGELLACEGAILIPASSQVPAWAVGSVSLVPVRLPSSFNRTILRTVSESICDGKARKQLMSIVQHRGHGTNTLNINRDS